eukprot:CAMPEP_0184302972 /NCGR_PEP_ID=MMETSP1049-20130417/12810_1 /TAXON_ID=77928 /ORGANISM="Proteomonas sulcata, Strain CCMP704" /LENGTH=191 /DNA_ID=CAMNT_0026614379 /DNA_START=251 /DNA_END=826 /DNA_ORIENTATION=+
MAAEGLSRREALRFGAAAALGAPLLGLPGQASAYQDDDRGFLVELPNGWIEGEAEFPGGGRNPAAPKIITFLNPENKDVNVALVSYSIRPDNSKLGSLGNIDDVAATILGTSGNLDAEMFAQKEKSVGSGPAYFFDYRIKDKRLKTVFTTQTADNGSTWLVTLTCQAPQDEWSKIEETFTKVASSFKTIKY